LLLLWAEPPVFGGCLEEQFAFFYMIKVSRNDKSCTSVLWHIVEELDIQRDDGGVIFIEDLHRTDGKLNVGDPDAD
jgi:hypothetical protein